MMPITKYGEVQLSKLEWITVLFTPDNYEELYELALPHKESNKYIGVSYVVDGDYYVMTDNIGSHWDDLIIKTFDLLPRILLLQDIGMSTESIRDTLNISYIPEDYNAWVYSSKA